MTGTNRLQASSYKDERFVFAPADERLVFSPADEQFVFPVDERLVFSPVGAGLPANLGMNECLITGTNRLQASSYKDERFVFSPAEERFVFSPADERLVFSPAGEQFVFPVDERLVFSPVGAGLPANLGVNECLITGTNRLQASSYKDERFVFAPAGEQFVFPR